MHFHTLFWNDCQPHRQEALGHVMVPFPPRPLAAHDFPYKLIIIIIFANSNEVVLLRIRGSTKHAGVFLYSLSFWRGRVCVGQGGGWGAVMFLRLGLCRQGSSTKALPPGSSQGQRPTLAFGHFSQGRWGSPRGRQKPSSYLRFSEIRFLPSVCCCWRGVKKAGGRRTRKVWKEAPSLWFGFIRTCCKCPQGIKRALLRYSHVEMMPTLLWEPGFSILRWLLKPRALCWLAIWPWSPIQLTQGPQMPGPIETSRVLAVDRFD